MFKRTAIVALLTAWCFASVADAQVITTYSPVASDVVTVTSDDPVTTYYAPGETVTTYSAPVQNAPVTTYFAPSAPVTTYYAPTVTTYFAPSAPVTTYYAPAPATQVVVPRTVLRPAPYWIYDPSRILPRRRWRLVVP